jgi:hypothetical protein
VHCLYTSSRSHVEQELHPLLGAPAFAIYDYQ